VTITIIAVFDPGTDETITTPGRFTAPRTAVGIVEVAIVAGLKSTANDTVAAASKAAVTYTIVAIIFVTIITLLLPLP
jgi:hypothetical protein